MSSLLNPEEMHIWHIWKTLYSGVYNQIIQEISAKSGLSEADFSVLSRVSELGSGRLRQQELAGSLQWSKSRLSHHLTRMEERKLIKRQPLDDEPIVIVVLTDEGKAAIELARPVHAEAVRRFLLDRLTPQEMEVISSLAARLNGGS